MVEVICAVVAALATIVCAYIAAKNTEAEKKRQKYDQKAEARAKERAREARLQLAMIAANSELTVGVAVALQQGHTNGEVEAGLEAVRSANQEYRKFLEEIAIDHMN